jgi:hypothetical protein
VRGAELTEGGAIFQEMSVWARAVAIAVSAVAIVLAFVLIWTPEIPLGLDPVAETALITEADVVAATGAGMEDPVIRSRAFGMPLAGTQAERLLADGRVQIHQVSRVAADPIAAALAFQDWSETPPVRMMLGMREAQRERAEACAPWGEGCGLWWLTDAGERAGFLVIYQRGRRLMAVSAVGLGIEDPAAVREFLLPRLQAFEHVQTAPWF